jgi:NHLM bacteriocin system ABC transporter peptidase/ATP-binding protein
MTRRDRLSSLARHGQALKERGQLEARRVLRRLRGGNAPSATPLFLQTDQNECGVVCLRIVLAHYGVHVPMAELRKSCGTSRQGFRLDYIAKTARRFGLKASGVAADATRLSKLPMPLIALWNFSHLVVVESVVDDEVQINDPALGRIFVSRKEFEDGYSGVALIAAKGPDFAPVGRPATIWSNLARRLEGSRRPFLFVVLASLGLVVPGWLLPSFTRQFVDNYFTDRQEYWLWPMVIGILVTLALQAAFTFLQQSSLARLQTKFAMTWSARFYYHLLRLPLSFFAERHAGDLSNRFKYVDRVAGLVAGQLTIGLMNLVSVAFYGVIMLLYDVGLALLSFVTVGLGWLVLSRGIRHAGEASERWYVERGGFFGSALTLLTHREQFKANGSEGAMFTQLVGRHARVIEANQRQEWRRILLRAGTRGFEAVHAVLVLVYGSHLIMTGDFTMGMLIAYQVLTVSFITPVVAIIGLNTRLYEAKAMMGAMDEVMEHPMASEFAEDAVAGSPAALVAWSGGITLEDVSFGYNPFDPPVIEGVSLTIPPGARVALVGASGSGRTTLGHLIAGLHRPSSGRISFNGRPIETIPRREFRGQVALLEQSGLLFDTTLRNNLTLWDETIPEEQMVAAAKAAMAHDLIIEREGGYDHMVVANGTNFSSGEIQRLEIARVLAQRPSILILDEGTSFLDAVVEAQVVENVRRLGITCIFIAHRLSTVRTCNQIVVFDRGRVAEQGTHEELMSLGGHYSRLVESW